jgi:hypothetical protein
LLLQTHFKLFSMRKIQLNSKTLNNFFGFLFKMDTDTKKKLIIKLTESIEDNNPVKSSISSMYGSWVDNRDSEIIIKEINDSRTSNRNVIGF